MGKVTLQKCDSCLAVHPVVVDICDACGSVSFTPFFGKEPVHTVGDIVRAKNHGLDKRVAKEIIEDKSFGVVNGNSMNVSGLEQPIAEKAKVEEETKEEVVEETTETEVEAEIKEEVEDTKEAEEAPEETKAEKKDKPKKEKKEKKG